MTTTPDVDWAAVEERARRRELLSVPLLAAWFGSWAVVTERFILWEGDAAWWVVTAYTVGFFVLLAVQRSVPRLRRNAVLGHRIQFALREHVDPGPEARGRTDVFARRQAGLRWAVWGSPLIVLSVLAGGRWDRPGLAVPGAVVFTALTAVGVRLLLRQFRDAARWIADPPGPAREVAPPTKLETWTSGRRLLLLWGGLVVLGVIAGLVVGLAG